jgi:NAD(P)-dependent dehydrogenase (short-subunit alcohol dehydrogenase family)
MTTTANGRGLLADRVAFVTGAARGIGLAIAQRYAEEGARVVLGDVDSSAVEATAQTLAAAGVGATGVAVDVTSSESVQAALKACLERHGRVDIVVANAGVMYLGHVLDTPLREWQRVIDINLTGAFLTCQVFGRQLVEQGTGGMIILTSSFFGLRGGRENGAYAASKFGMVGLMQCLAAELGPYGVLVNAVCPGQVDTQLLRTFFRDRALLRHESEQSVRRSLEDRVPLGRLAQTEEVADAYVFLASGLNRYITGQSISVDGGWSIGTG